MTVTWLAQAEEQETMKITADRNVCIGSGQCASHAPALFAQDDETGQVVVLHEEVSEAAREEAELAAMACPVQALSLSRDKAGSA